MKSCWHCPSGFSAWEPFRDFIPENERDNFIVAYNKRLNSDDIDVQVECFFLLVAFSTAICSFDPLLLFLWLLACPWFVADNCSFLGCTAIIADMCISLFLISRGCLCLHMYLVIIEYMKLIKFMQINLE